MLRAVDVRTKIHRFGVRTVLAPLCAVEVPAAIPSWSIGGDAECLAVSQQHRAMVESSVLVDRTRHRLWAAPRTVGKLVHLVQVAALAAWPAHASATAVTVVGELRCQPLRPEENRASIRCDPWLLLVVL